ncbi:M14 family metallopeptidase [Anoxybacillus sp. J5B_2022]|uniref:M14 family metallopeptidase n=1 Tax=Anoxybacillus sp. J5B_2022 TaxID=3003246 RepID=UPI0022855CFA|nr:M14 family metallocarboxypeptidase [Anoxybacillus sp. J5B_2022]MCZ0754628.1 M14 family metallocarboxypeptidase [Anoxybacillus sp. J5B_2022]
MIYARKGDTWEWYSQWFSVPPELIRDANPHLPHELHEGEVVRIPGYDVVTYHSQTAETFDQIAKSLSLPVEALERMNEDRLLLRIPRRLETPIVNGKQNYDFTVMKQDIDDLCTYYPFMKQRVIGTSVLGCPLIELSIGRGPKKIHVNASFHANEWITTAVVMAFVNEYVLRLTNGTCPVDRSLLDYYKKVTLSIVPMVNPDGVNLVLHGPPAAEPYRSNVLQINDGSSDFSQWKANICGVDLNNQFPAKWEIEQQRKIPKAPAPRDFPGVAPLTEPEVKAMVALTEDSDFSLIVAFHTQGKEIYWGYEGFEPKESELIVNELANASGYQAIRYIDSHAGYRDWFIQTWKRPGYTVELGEGVNPLPLEQFETIYEASRNMLFALLAVC